MGNDPAAFLAGAVEAARAAGAVIQEGARNRTSLNIERKTVNDFVSEIDKGAERVIIDTLSTRFTGHGFKAEESGRAAVRRAAPGSSIRSTGRRTSCTASRITACRSPCESTTPSSSAWSSTPPAGACSRPPVVTAPSSTAVRFA
jgi:3'-phosphoadenosine 5'-phosphosulfate (PAPS) 3'-phosphatase